MMRFIVLASPFPFFPICNLRRESVTAELMYYLVRGIK
ncbi:hypothetical protein ASZ90_013848 [hydrocarbon metagenome]|uniref:Uncharacterized protein n=1 Tax=hydrocarbon metagenome TaxID=938273 RepID=A0A0W8F6F9_9ZZZZ